MNGGMDLLTSLLSLEPGKRLDLFQILTSKFMDEIREEPGKSYASVHCQVVTYNIP
jgi:hypothetical protein